MCQDSFSCKEQKHTQTTSRPGRCGNEVVSKRLTHFGTNIGTEKPLEVRAAPGSPFVLSFSWTPRPLAVVSLPLSELQPYSPLPADRLASSAHSTLLPLNFGSYQARIALPAPLSTISSDLHSHAVITNHHILWVHFSSNTKGWNYGHVIECWSVSLWIG